MTTARTETESLDELTDDLTAALALAEQRFGSLDLKVSVHVTLPGSDGKLHWKKHNGAWGLCFESVEGVCPISKASRRVRIEAAGLLKALHQALLDERKAQIVAAKEAIKEIDAFLDDLDAPTPGP